MARHGKLHAYNNFFGDVKYAGIECSDSASCYVENNVFNIDAPILVYRLYGEDGAPDVATQGFVYTLDNMFSLGGENLQDETVFRPEYDASIDAADVELAVRVKNEAGPR